MVGRRWERRAESGVFFFVVEDTIIGLDVRLRKKIRKRMKTILIVLAIAVGALALMMGGLGLKMLLHKEKEFKRPCTNATPRQAVAPTAPAGGKIEN